MPELSRFYGIQIRINQNDHHPPHFHARYNEYQAMYSVETGLLLEGRMPRNADRMIREWAALHRNELRKNWEESQKPNPRFEEIAPLE